MKPIGFLLTGIKSQGFVSRAIKLGSVLRYQPKAARAASTGQIAFMVIAALLSIHFHWSLLGAVAAVFIGLAWGIVCTWVIAAVGADNSAYWGRFSHSVQVLEVDDQGRPTKIAEAVKKGVVAREMHYKPGDFTFVAVPMSDADRVQVVAFAGAVVAARWRYGFVTFAALALYCVTAGIPWFPTLVLEQGNTAICSGFVASALTRAGYIFDKPPAFMMPADLAAYFGVT